MNIVPTRPSLTQIAKTGLVAAAIAIAANSLIYFGANLLQPVVLPFEAVIISSLMGFGIATLLYLLLSRIFGARAWRIFAIISVVFLVFYAWLPINAMTEAPAPTIPVFNISTMLATQFMHLVSGAIAIGRFRKLQ